MPSRPRIDDLGTRLLDPGKDGPIILTIPSPVFPRLAASTMISVDLAVLAYNPS